MTRTCSRFIIGLLIVTTIAPASMHADDRPVAFLHGFNSDRGGWLETAERLRVRTAIEVHAPTVNWRAKFGDQVNELRGQPGFASLPPSTIAIGHSNGGLVAREWARRDGLKGVVTIGTPHRGAPALPNYGHWVAFNSNASWLSSSILMAFSRWTDWAWALGYVNEAIGWVLDFSVWSTVFLGATLGLDRALPVASEMHPYSAYLHDLNSSGNVNHEQSTLDTRVGIVSIAHNYFWAGPARVITPDHADGIAAALYGAAYGLMFWGNYILASADITDFDAMDQAMSLIALSGHLQSIDPIYCAVVSSMDLSSCVPNDGLVPYTSQEYPYAPNLYIGQSNDGPVHTRERENSEDVLYYALVNVAGVPLRSTPPPPPPPPPGPGGGDPGPGPSDPNPGGGGNSSACGGAQFRTTLRPDEYLYAGEAIDSPDGCYRLIYQGDGNLVLYDVNWVPLWASHTENTSPGLAMMQGDGNFVVYDADWVARWASNTSQWHNAFVTLQNDANVVVYGADWQPLWATNTAR
jgi:pimeloyl-ACP methyl ester carboxylesterase